MVTSAPVVLSSTVMSLLQFCVAPLHTGTSGLPSLDHVIRSDVGLDPPDSESDEGFDAGLLPHPAPPAKAANTSAAMTNLFIAGPRSDSLEHSMW